MARPDPDPGMPIKLDPCSNGEFVPPPPTPLVSETIRRANESVDRNARRTGMTRRDFLLSACASATTLSVLAACSSESGGSGGGTFTVPTEATIEPEAAQDVLGGTEFIFDVQNHLLEYPPGSDAALPSFSQSECDADDPYDCYRMETFLDLMFLQSDTSVVMLSAVPFPGELLSPEVMAQTMALAERIGCDGRVLMQAQANPSLAPSVPAMQDAMAAIAAEFPIGAWKTYTHAGGPGWFLDDHDLSAPQVGDAFLEQAVALGVPVVAVHKGFGGGSGYASPVDIGPAATAHPDISFVVYHSGYEAGGVEGPYDPGGEGIDRLIASVRDARLGPGSNVYGELGSTWKLVMGDPDQAAHVLGKLLVNLGEDNVVWGTDSLWYGTPQDQIEAFRTFEITPEFQERFGYPALTPELKAKILGGTSAALYGVDPQTVPCEPSSEEIAEARLASVDRNRTYGPTTADEVAEFLDWDERRAVPMV